jgi:hypothetical protein
MARVPHSPLFAAALFNQGIARSDAWHGGAEEREEEEEGGGTNTVGTGVCIPYSNE